MTTGSAGAGPVRALLKKVFTDHRTFLLSEVAMYSFVPIVTGTFLALFFQSSMTEGIYHGSYAKLDNVPLSQACASTLNISFEVRGGLLVRQIHHWAPVFTTVARVAPARR